jgi:hypothetical protein
LFVYDKVANEGMTKEDDILQLAEQLGEEYHIRIRIICELN